MYIRFAFIKGTVSQLTNSFDLFSCYTSDWYIIILASLYLCIWNMFSEYHQGEDVDHESLNL